MNPMGIAGSLFGAGGGGFSSSSSATSGDALAGPLGVNQNASLTVGGSGKTSSGGSPVGMSMPVVVGIAVAAFAVGYIFAKR
jgi:hypothetical protein